MTAPAWIILGAPRRPIFPRCALCGAEAPEGQTLGGSTVHPGCALALACSSCDQLTPACSLDQADRCQECQP